MVGSRLAAMESADDGAGASERDRDVVERVIDAVNAHDLEAFVACYTQEAAIEDGYDQVLARGHDELRRRYGAMLERYPRARWQVLHRIDTGAFVVQYEEVTGRGETSRHVCVYLVQDDRIGRERVFA